MTRDDDATTREGDGADFEISSVLVSKDPQVAITYVERDARGTRTFLCEQVVDEVVVGDLAAWSDPKQPMDEAARERVLDRIAAWAFSGGSAGPAATAIFDAAGTVRRIPAEYQIVLESSAWTWRLKYREPGRHVGIDAVELLGDDGGRSYDRPHLFVRRGAVPRRWSNHAPMTDAEASVLLARVAAFEGTAVTVEDESAPWSAWDLAEQVASLTGTFVVALAPGRDEELGAILQEVNARARGEGRTDEEGLAWLERVELPALATGRTGWTVDGARAWLAPIVDDGVELARAALFADEARFAPDAAPNGETRGALWAWAYHRARGAVVPEELAARGVAVVVERRGVRGTSSVAMYEDGRVRFVGPRGAIACEPGAATDLPGIALALEGATLGPRDATPLGEREIRCTMLTCGGALFARGTDLGEAEEAGERLVAALLAWAFPKALPIPRAPVVPPAAPAAPTTPGAPGDASASSASAERA